MNSIICVLLIAQLAKKENLHFFSLFAFLLFRFVYTSSWCEILRKFLVQPYGQVSGQWKTPKMKINKRKKRTKPNSAIIIIVMPSRLLADFNSQAQFLFRVCLFYALIRENAIRW